MTVKYITKDLCCKKGDLTNSMLWLHRKQSYSISKGFVSWMKTLYDISCDLSEPSVDDLIYTIKDNCNSDFYIWEFLGVLVGRDIGLSGDLWFVEMKKPPPPVLEKVEYEALRWRSVHGGRSR